MENLNIENKYEKIQKIWISNKIFSYRPLPGGSIVDPQYRKRSYSLWNHANELIENAENSFQLEDGIIDLKRALNHRLKLIEELYGFKKNIPEYKNINYLEILGRLSIVRSSILKKLLIIRNNIEHNDYSAPEKERCLELSDVVWYFLKSTDQMCNIIYNDIECIDTKNDNLFFTVSSNYESPFNVYINCVLNQKDISYSHINNFIELDIKEGVKYIDNNRVHVIGLIPNILKHQEVILKFIFNTCI